MNGVAFAPHELGLMLAAASSDGTISVLTYQSGQGWASQKVDHVTIFNQCRFMPVPDAYAELHIHRMRARARVSHLHAHGVLLGYFMPATGLSILLIQAWGSANSVHADVAPLLPFVIFAARHSQRNREAITLSPSSDV